MAHATEVLTVPVVISEIMLPPLASKLNATPENIVYKIRKKVV